MINDTESRNSMWRREKRRHNLLQEGKRGDMSNLCLNNTERAEDQVQQVGEGLLAEAARIFQEQGKLTEEILSALHFVYQAPLVSALELVDKAAVTELVSPSGRSVFQVIGSSGTPYVCFKTSHYCSCPAFTFSVLHKGDHVMCKHHLAVKMSAMMRKTKTLHVSDQELADTLSAIE